MRQAFAPLGAREQAHVTVGGGIADSEENVPTGYLLQALCQLANAGLGPVATAQPEGAYAPPPSPPPDTVEGLSPQQIAQAMLRRRPGVVTAPPGFLPPAHACTIYPPTYPQPSAGGPPSEMPPVLSDVQHALGEQIVSRENSCLLPAAWQDGQQVGPREMSSALVQPAQRRQQGATRVQSITNLRLLQAALQEAIPGTGEVAALLLRVTFRLRLPGLTAIMGRLTKQGQWAVSLEVFQGLPSLGLECDTTVCNAALAACTRGCVWDDAKEIFDLMVAKGVTVDHITYSTMLSVPRRRKLWSVVIEFLVHMSEAFMPLNLVDCATIVAGLAAEGRWVLAEALVFYTFRAEPEFMAPMPLQSSKLYSTTAGDLEIVDMLRAAQRRAMAPSPKPPRSSADSGTSGIRGGSSSGSGSSGRAQLSGTECNGSAASQRGDAAFVNNSVSMDASSGDGSAGSRQLPSPFGAPLNGNGSGSGASSNSLQSMRGMPRATLSSEMGHANSSESAAIATTEQLSRLRVTPDPSPLAVRQHAQANAVQRPREYGTAPRARLSRHLRDWAEHGARHPSGLAAELVCCSELISAYVSAREEVRAMHLLRCMTRAGGRFTPTMELHAFVLSAASTGAAL